MAFFKRLAARSGVFGLAHLRVVTFTILSVFLPFTATVFAQNAEQHIDAGTALMSNGDHEAALTRFEAAIAIDRAEPTPLFFAGAALNRLGRSGAALRQLDGALYLYSLTRVEIHPDLQFERGWALLRERRYEDAVTALELYESKQPGRGQALEFLGRAYIGLERYDLAERKLNDAATVQLALATIAHHRGDDELVDRELQALVRDQRQSPLTVLLAEQASQPVPQDGRPWALSFGAGGGYNDNAVAVGDDEPLGSEVTNESDNFLRVFANTAYRWTPEEWNITASYTMQMDRYEDVSRVNQLDHILGVGANRNITRDTGIGLRFQEQYTLVDDDSFRNEIRAVPSIWWRLHERAVIEVSYIFASTNFLVPVISGPLERDNETHYFAPMLYVNMPEWRTNIRLGYQQSWSDAKGSDYDYEGRRFSVQLDTSLPASISGRFFIRSNIVTSTIQTAPPDLSRHGMIILIT